ncbi:MAG: hypothetical protein R2856_12100 [Caldilineaceae bacterium]
MGRAQRRAGEFDTPYGVALHPSGNVYVADTGNHRIQVFGDTPLATPSRLYRPVSICQVSNPASPRRR